MLEVKKIIRYSLNEVDFYRYKKLILKNEKVKGIGKGKRVFLIGSGNSIKKIDLNLLSNDNVIVLNNGCVIDEYKKIMSGSGIKVHLIAPIHPPQTDQEWVAWFKKLQANILTDSYFFVGLNSYKRNAFNLIKENSLFCKHQVNWYYTGKEMPASNRFESLFKGLNLTKMIYTGEAASIYGLILAEYMQFDEIILLGMDHDYFLYDDEGSMRVYSEAEHQKNELNRTFNSDFYVEEFYRQYKIFKKYSVLRDIFKSRVYSCSGPVLKVFKRKKFDQLVN